MTQLLLMPRQRRYRREKPFFFQLYKSVRLCEAELWSRNVANHVKGRAISGLISALPKKIESSLNVTNWQTKSQFHDASKSPGDHLIVFAAKWCGFCTRFLDQARSLSSDSNTQLFLVDTDNPDESLWDEYSVKIVPTILVFKDGQVVFRRDGRSGAGLGMSDLQDALSKMKSAG